nr:MAG TPA: hypothetical protein [Caudoviricetes sp.]
MFLIKIDWWSCNLKHSTMIKDSHFSSDVLSESYIYPV